MFKKVNKRIILVIISIIGIIVFNGCSQREVGLETVDELLFENIEIVAISKGFAQSFYDLNENEIKILRTSIRNGTELSELQEDTTSSLQNEVVVFDITKKDKTGGNIIYDEATKYLYIPKSLVHYKNKREYEQRQSLFNKYLLGVYRLRPSADIKKLLK